MSEFQNTIDLLGDEETTKRIIEKTISEFNDDVITVIGEVSMTGATQLTSVNCPNVTTIGNWGLSETSIKVANFPNLLYVNKGAFQYCASLTSVNFPLAKTVGDFPFQNCTALTSVNLPLATSIGRDAFSGCTSLVHITLQSWNSGLTRTGVFENCTSLEWVDLPKAVIVGGTTFKNCTSLKTVILRSGSICSLSATNAFDGTPFASGGTGGTLLVKSALVESYKTATNWSVIWGFGHNRFLALEDYTVDGTITGEIDWDKVNALA